MSTSIKFPLIIVGSQWGDEGKGKVVDILAKDAKYVVRFNGGNNAGHSVVLNGEKYKLSLMPSGVLHKKKLFLSQGVVIDPKVLLDEIDFFNKRKIKVDLTIDPRVHIVMPYHKELDAATEKWKGKKATGSLHLGIGYCYEDKNNRFGIRFEDLIDPKSLREKLEMYFPLKKRHIEKVFEQKSNLKMEEIYTTYAEYGKKLKKYLGDVSDVIQKALLRHSGKPSQTRRIQNPDSGVVANASPQNDNKVLFEGAHGTFLDAIYGTYPFTTAVYTISGSVFPYVGIAPQKIYSLGIVKAYTTRVGNGPFPTELSDRIGEKIRANGAEFGTVSKRPRRCGWLDLAMIKTAIRLSGLDYIAITKLDVLSSLPVIKICTHYTLHGKVQKEIPAMMSDFSNCKPVYKEFKGWKEDVAKVRKWDDLPIEAKRYLKFIEKEIKVPVKIVSVGAEREANIFL